MENDNAWTISGMIAAAAMIVTTPASAQTGEKYVVVGMHLDQVMQPKTVFDGAADCNNNSLCATALSAISAASGYPIDKAVAVAALLSSQNFGEGNGFNIGLPSGLPLLHGELQTDVDRAARR